MEWCSAREDQSHEITHRQPSIQTPTRTSGALRDGGIHQDSAERRNDCRQWWRGTPVAGPRREQVGPAPFHRRRGRLRDSELAGSGAVQCSCSGNALRRNPHQQHCVDRGGGVPLEFEHATPASGGTGFTMSVPVVAPVLHDVILRNQGSAPLEGVRGALRTGDLTPVVAAERVTQAGSVMPAANRA